jgi:hypothetical protein
MPSISCSLLAVHSLVKHRKYVSIHGLFIHCPIQHHGTQHLLTSGLAILQAGSNTSTTWHSNSTSNWHNGSELSDKWPQHPFLTAAAHQWHTWKARHGIALHNLAWSGSAACIKIQP